MKKRSHVSDYFMTQEEVAKVLNLSRAEVQQIEYQALKKLKQSDRLKKYVGAKEN